MTVPSAEPKPGPAPSPGPGLSAPDPRPRVERTAAGLRLAGWRCRDCGYPVAVPGPWCPRCRGELVAAAFGPAGTAWASTVVHVRLPGREPPWGMVYVDLAGGPRVLGHLEPARPVAVGTRMELTGLSEDGDLLFRPLAVPQ